TAAARAEAIRLAKRVRQTDQDLRDNDAQITEFFKHTAAAGLTQETGVGPVSAATVLMAWGLSWWKPQRSGLGRTSRHQPTVSLLRDHHQVSAQQWRRSQAQRGT